VREGLPREKQNLVSVLAVAREKVPIGFNVDSRSADHVIVRRTDPVEIALILHETRRAAPDHDRGAFRQLSDCPGRDVLLHPAVPEIPEREQRVSTKPSMVVSFGLTRPAHSSAEQT
jgi:hypothetical protein